MPLVLIFASNFLATEALPVDAVQRLGSPQFRHGTEIVSSALSQDGKLLATAGTRTVILWDVATGRRLHTFPSDGIFVSPSTVCFSATGSRLAICRQNDIAEVWDTKSGRLDWSSKQAKLISPQFCRFGATDDDLVVGLRNTRRAEPFLLTIEFRKLPKGEVLLVSECDPSWQYPLPGGRFAICQGPLNYHSLIEMGSARVVAIAEGWRPAAVSPDGEKMVRLRSDGRMEIIPTRIGPVVIASPIPERFKRTAPDGQKYWAVEIGFSEDARELWIFSSWYLDDFGRTDIAMRAIHRREVASGKELPLLAGHGHVPSGIHYTRDGKTIVTTGKDGTIRCWDRASGRALGPRSNPAGHPAFSSDGTTFGMASSGVLAISDLRSGEQRQFITEVDSPIAFALSPDGRTAAARTYECTIHLIDAKSGRKSQTLTRLASDKMVSLGWLRFSPDGDALAATGRWDTRLWDLKSGRYVYRDGDGHATFLGNTQGMAVYAKNFGFEVRDAFTGVPNRTHPLLAGNPNYPVWGVDMFAVSPNGRWAAIGDEGGHLILQDMISGNLMHRLPVFPPFPMGAGSSPYRPSALAFSADSKWLAVGTSTHAVEVWEVASGQRLLHFEGHDTAVRVVQFAPDGRTLWSAGNDGLAYRWDVLPRSQAPRDWGRVWIRLTRGDPSSVPATLREIVDDPSGAASFLRKMYQPPTRRDRERIAALIQEFGDEEFAVREVAEEDIFSFGLAALAPLQAASRDPNPERSVRVARVLRRLAPEERAASLRAGRIATALELAGTPEARGLLAEWSKIAPDEYLGAEAKAATERLSRSSR